MNFFGFIDETGILQDVKNQPYFALGLLRLKDTSDLLQQIMAIKARHKGIYMANNNGHSFDIGELKFNKLKTNKHLEIYKDILKACFNYEHFYFSARVVDKAENKRKKEEIDTWNLQIKLSKFHIKAHCKNNNKIAIIADYLNRPKGKPSFESQISKLGNVFNSCMLESDTSIFIQIVDILIGAIVYRYKNPVNDNKRKSVKMQLVEFIETELLNKAKSKENKDQFLGLLKGKFSIFSENFYFSVYDK